MKRFIALFLLSLLAVLSASCAFCAESVEINAQNFPDEKFRAYVSEKFDKPQDGILSKEEIANVTNIDVSLKNISSLKGVEYFTALTKLYCGTNNLTALDISENTALTTLDCSNNKLKALDISKNTALTTLDCSDNPLKALDVSKNTKLDTIRCYSNDLTALDVSNHTALTHLYCYINQLTTLDVSGNTSLDLLDCSYNQLMELDLSHNTALTYLHCYSNDLTVLDVSNNTKLERIWCYSNDLTALDVSNNAVLRALGCGNNKLTALDVSNNAALRTLDCSENNITELDIHKCPQLKLNNLTVDSNVRIIHGTQDGLPSFTSHSLILSGQLGLDFYVNVPESIDTKGAYADFTINGKTGTPSMFSEDKKVGEDYRFTCYINSIQMADNITAMFCYSDDARNMAAAEDYTVKDYLDAIISSADISTNSPDLVALAEAIKDYGHYVQIPLSDFNGWKLGTDHAIMDYASSDIALDSADVKAKLRNYKLEKNIDDSGIEKLLYDLELESETAINICLKPGSDAGDVSAYITDDDNEFDGTKDIVVYDPKNSMYVITIGGISAHKLGKVYNVRIKTDKGENFSVKISALSYADAVMQAQNDGENINDDLKRAVISLYKYYAATMKYRGESLTE